MANLVIVAIPATDDEVWQVSSQKVPHMTLCFLGPAETNPNINAISDYVKERAAKLAPFNLRVDHRGTLGSDEADVLFFSEDISWQVHDFRDSLLSNVDIRSAYNAIPQHNGWKPHLTLGYPDTPANKDTWDPTAAQYVRFDKVAVWFAEFGGFSFPLSDNTPKMSTMEETDGFDVAWSALEHHGVKGQKWGVRKAVRGAVEKHKAKQIAKADTRFEETSNHLSNKVTLHNAVHDQVNQHIGRINAKPEYVKAANDGTLLNDNHPVTQKYHKEYMDAYVHEMNKVASTVTNASGTKKWAVREAPQFLGFEVHTVDINHASENSFRVKFVVDAQGKVTDLVLDDDTMTQGALAIGEILKHHGVKGQKWGVTRARASVAAKNAEAKKPQPVQVTTKKRGSKSEVKTTGGQNQPIHKDAVKARSVGQQAKKSGLDTLSNEELKTYANRLDLEQRVSRLQSQDSHGKGFIQRFFANKKNRAAAQKALSDPQNLDRIKKGRAAYKAARAARLAGKAAAVAA